MSRSRRKALISVSVAVLALISVAIYSWDCNRRGEADREAIVFGREPVYAREAIPIPDGGSIVYVGRGYEVTRLRRLIPYQYGSNFAYAVGWRLRWKTPVRIFRYDDEYIRYIEPLESAAKRSD